MEVIEELMRLAAPAPKPQAIAFDGTQLWLGSIETQRLYAVDAHNWTVRDEISMPGKPWGMTVAGDELRVLLGETADDHRVIRRVIPGRGVHDDREIPCPDDTGSHLSFDGDTLYVSQWYNRRIIALDDAGIPGTTVECPHQICGHTIVDGHFYCITTETEDTGPYWLTRIDARGATQSVDLATIGFPARGLAFDGTRFWTNHREANETVAFARVD